MQSIFVLLDFLFLFKTTITSPGGFVSRPSCCFLQLLPSSSDFPFNRGLCMLWILQYDTASEQLPVTTTVYRKELDNMAVRLSWPSNILACAPSVCFGRFSALISSRIMSATTNTTEFDTEESSTMDHYNLGRQAFLPFLSVLYQKVLFER